MHNQHLQMSQLNVGMGYQKPSKTINASGI